MFSEKWTGIPPKLLQSIKYFLWELNWCNSRETINFAFSYSLFLCIVSLGSSKLSSKLTNAGGWHLHPLVDLKISLLCFGQFFVIPKLQTMYVTIYLTLFYFIIRRTSPHAHTGCTSTQAKLWISEQGWGKCASGLQPHRRRYIYNVLLFSVCQKIEMVDVSSLCLRWKW